METRKQMEAEEMMVLCQDVLGYMNEHRTTLEKAYEDKGVPEEIQMSFDEIEEFLYTIGIIS